MEKKIKHSVLIVTYKQEDYIGITIQSILSQTELPYEIIILDDCSPDNTWEVVSKYADENKSLIKAYRNDVNLGIFQNIQKLKTLFTGNVISYCSGDDLLGEKTIQSVNEKIKKEGLEPETEKFLIITNSQHLYPNGDTTLWDNYKEKNISAIKTRLRYGLSYRGVGFSKNLLLSTPSEQEILDKNPEVGYNADFFKGFEEIIGADKLFYVNEVGGIYRLDVGVTSVKNDLQKWKKHQSAYHLVGERYKTNFDKKDHRFIKFIVAGDEFKMERTFKNWCTTFYFFIVNLGNFSYNNPAIRNFHYLLPVEMVEWLKFKVYPIYLNFRKK